jgi:2-succinyl-6-hydroxy-2,4-cyclohexadiene-1-carboxylate synthase
VTADLFCLHGFLGSAADWDAAVDAANPMQRVHAVDWLTRYGLTASTWEELAARVNGWALAAAPVGPRAVAAPVAERVLVGYSLGGRVAMHALIAAPAQWTGGVIIAANPGLASAAERERRLAADRTWADRFRAEPWHHVIAEWNAQPVFAGEAPPFERPDTPVAREAAVVALERWSVANQLDLRRALGRLTRPVLWIAGERDVTYAALMRECAALNPRFQYVQVPGAGHRAPWTSRAYFEKVLRDWLTALPTLAARVHEDSQTT